MNRLEVLQKARFNTALLAAFFVVTTIKDVQAGNTVMIVMGTLAAALTIRDVVVTGRVIREETKGVTDGN